MASFTEIRDHFLAIRGLAAGARPGALAQIADPYLRAEVASLLDHDLEAPFLRERPRPRDAAPPALLGETLAARYEVQSAVAEGGFGWVFRGRDLDAAEPVAIKVFKPVRDPRTAADLEAAARREVEVLASLAGRVEHIVAYRDVGTWHDAGGGAHGYLVMEWLDGPSLRTRIEDGPPLDLAAAVELLTPVAEALAAAHAAGVAHRDVKPSNILLAGPADAPAPKLVDFGAVKRASDRARGFESTGEGVRMVSYDYSAPEQLDRRHGASGPWTDVYALALVLVELQLGAHPWAQLDVVAKFAAITDRRRRPTPRALGCAVGRAAERVFARALGVDPRRRPPDAAALWADLRAALG